MLRVFDLLLLLYPAEYRAEFGAEMRAVFLALAASARPRWRFCRRECLGLLEGSLREQGRSLKQRAAPLACGALVASGGQFLLYFYLLPVRRAGLSRVLGRLVSHLFLVLLLVRVAFSQPATQNPAALELAKGIYAASFTALRQATTLADLRKLSDDIDAPEWVSVDRLGRTILTKKEADRDLEGLLALPPDRRVTAMEILWAEQDADRLAVLAWMMPNRAESRDTGGEFGKPGETHVLTRATLIRDVFARTGAGWRRIRHDKLTPNDFVLAVDGSPRMVPPMDQSRRVAPAK